MAGIDRDVWGAGAEAVAQAPVVFQDHALFPWMTALDNIAFGPSCLGRGKGQARAIAMDLLERFGMREAAQCLPHQLSGGMRSRVGLARALAVDPPCVLLDEPLNAVDRVTKATLIADLQRYLSDGGRIVLVTHELAEVTSLGDTAIILRAPGVAVQVPRCGDATAWMHQLTTAAEDPRASTSMGQTTLGRLPSFTKALS
jgi:ABC-type nitrate/sulfonate/bicarbonate transport system ATPase subunit